MSKKIGKKKFDELAKIKWIENYKFRLFIDLHMQGGVLRDYPMLDLSNKQSRLNIQRKISSLNYDLKKIMTKNIDLIERLKNMYGLETDHIISLRESLYMIDEKISNIKARKKVSGRTLVKGKSSQYIYDLLIVFGPNNFEWEWFQNFFKKEISNKKFPNLIFERMPRNISLPNITFDSYDDRYWYKKLKESQKDTKLKPFDVDFEQLEKLYLMILKQNKLNYIVARENLCF